MPGNIRKTGSDSAEKWRRNISAAGESVRLGVQQVTEAPALAAVRNQDAMRANLIAAIDDGKWARRLAGVSLEEWQRKTIDIGIPRIAAGATAAQPKVEAALNQIIAHADRGIDAIKGMPNVTLEDRINRMVTFVRHMADLEVER